MAFVYVLQSGEEPYFKIGRTRGDVEKRRKELSTGNPKPLVVFDTIETDHDALVENYLHKKFRASLSIEGDAKEFYVIDPEELKRGLQEAKQFMAEYIPLLEEADQYKDCDTTTGRLKQPDEDLLETYKALCDVRAQLDGLEFEKQLLENRLKRQIGEDDGLEGIATWRVQISTRLNQAALKEAHPEVYEKFSELQQSRVFRLL